MNFTLGPWLFLIVCVGVLGDDDIEGIDNTPREIITRPTSTRVVTGVIVNYYLMKRIPINKNGARGITMAMKRGGRYKYKLIFYPLSNAVRLYYVKRNRRVVPTPLLHVMVRPGVSSKDVDASIDIKQENGKDKFIFYKAEGVEEHSFMDFTGDKDGVTICEDD